MQKKITGYVLGALSLLSCFATTQLAQAGLLIDLDGIYYHGSLTGTSTLSTGRTFGGISVGGSIPKMFLVGWNVNIVNRTDGDSATGITTLTGTEMGPRFGMYLGKSQHICIALTYHPLANGTYTPAGSTALTWQGSGYQAEIAYLPEVTSTLFAGFKLIYDSVSYSKSTDSSNTTTAVSYSQSTIVPVVSLSWRF